MWLKRLWNASVFAPISNPHSVSDTLATLFHRSAATVYMLLSLWGAVGWYFGLNTMSSLWGDPIQDSYSLLVFVTAISASIGATFFPKHARTELLFASALVGLLVLYSASIVVYLFTFGDTFDIRMALLVLSLTGWVLPIARCVFVYRILISVAKYYP